MMTEKPGLDVALAVRVLLGNVVASETQHPDPGALPSPLIQVLITARAVSIKGTSVQCEGKGL